MNLSEKRGAIPPSTLKSYDRTKPLQCPFKVGLAPSPPPVSASFTSSPDTDEAPRRRSTHYEDSQLHSQHTVEDGPLERGVIPDPILETLPTFFHRGKTQKVVKVLDHLDIFLEKDLDLHRLNDIHSQLWMCGRPINARALHRHVLLNRRILITEQADLHLLYYSDILMLKPLPAYILSPQIWETHFNHNSVLHRNAAGLLMSYIWLVRSPIDFKLAIDKERPLLPAGLTWQDWKRIVDETLMYIDADSLQQVNERFQFGELRLGRINSIYRLNPRFIFQHFVRGYLYGYNRYAPFLHRNVAWVLAVSVLFSLVLSAMQVGTGLDSLKDNKAFNEASFGFVIFSCILVVAVLAFVILIFGFIFLFNMKEAIGHAYMTQRRRRQLAHQADQQP